MKLFKKKPVSYTELDKCPFCGKDASIKFVVECSRLYCRAYCPKGCVSRSRSIHDEFTMKNIEELMNMVIKDWNTREG